MQYVKVNNVLYHARVSAKGSDPQWDGRGCAEIKLPLTYAEALTLFTDGVKWSIINQPKSYTDKDGNTVTPDSTEHDQSEYCVAGDIIDHRDGTVTVKMGKLTELEETIAIFYGGVE